jgi:hypothetical protein
VNQKLTKTIPGGAETPPPPITQTLKQHTTPSPESSPEQSNSTIT